MSNILMVRRFGWDEPNLCNRHSRGKLGPRRDMGVASLIGSLRCESIQRNIVRLEGFEPPTLGSVDRCSNPLSYSRIVVGQPS